MVFAVVLTKKTLLLNPLNDNVSGLERRIGMGNGEEEKGKKMEL